jgi:hypothetical protein
MCTRSLVTPSGVSSAIMDANSITHPTLSSSLTVSIYGCCVPIALLRMGSPSTYIRTTNNVMHSLLFQAFHVATYLMILLPIKAILAFSSHVALFGTTPSYTHLQVRLLHEPVCVSSSPAVPSVAPPYPSFIASTPKIAVVPRHRCPRPCPRCWRPYLRHARPRLHTTPNPLVY